MIINTHDTPENREKIVYEFCRYTDRHGEYKQLLQKCIEDSLNYDDKDKDCDAFKSLYRCGIDGDRVGCERYDNGEKCKFQEKDEDEWEIEM